MHLQDSGGVDSGTGQRSNAFVEPRGCLPRKAGRPASEHLHKRNNPKTRFPSLYITPTITIIQQLGTMSIFYKFANDASSLKKFFPDKQERIFLSKLTKTVYYQNVSFLQSLVNSTTKLRNVNPHRKEKIFVQSSEVFFFFNDPLGATQAIEKQIKKTLSEKIHFKFAEAAAGQIAKLLSNLMKNPAQSDRDQYLIQQILSSLGVLLELNCKICLQIISPKVYKSYVNRNQSHTEGFHDRAKWYFFVGFFFGTTVINHPPILEKGEKKNNANDAYAIVQKQLMKFIDINTPIEYSVVFAKFKMLFLRYYDEYKFMYMTPNSSKEGFFGSIGDFFSNAASVVSSAVSTATSVYSTAMDVYQNTIKPIAQTLTPVLTPFLPGSVGTVLKMVAQNSVLFVEEDQIKATQSEYLSKFSFDYYKEERRTDVLYPSQKHIFDYLALIRLSSGDLAPQNYTGVLIKDDIILSQIPVKGQQEHGSPEQIKFHCYFFKKDNFVEKEPISLKPLSKANGNYYYFQLEKKIQQFTPWFQLDFKKDHASSAAFHQYLVNRDIFMFSYVKKPQQNRIFKAQVSKILKSTDKYFIDAFQKFQGCMGSPIFYIDNKTKKNIIIGTCTQDIQSLDLRNVINKDVSNQQMEKVKSTFLEESAFRSYYLPSKPGSNENSDFNQNKVMEESIIQRNNAEILANYQSLRSQLESNKATKPSFLSLVGIFKMQGSQTKYGVGVQISNNTLLTLKKYVINESNGSVYFRKDQFQGETLDFNISNDKQFEQFPIVNIGIIDSDFVKIQFKQRNKAEKLNPNYIKKNGLTYTQLIGGYFLEFDLTVDSLGRIDKVPVKWSYISSYQMEKLNFNSSSISNSTQRLYFAYQKGKLASSDYLGEYIFGISNPGANKINYIYEQVFFKNESEDKTLIENSQLTQNEKIISSDKRRPLYFQKELRLFEPVGIILHRYEPSFKSYFSGTGTLIQVTISLDGKDYTLKDRYMITCAHNFIFKKDGRVQDLSGENNKQAYLFQYGTSKHINDSDDFVQRFINLKEPNVIKNFSKVTTPPKYKENLKSMGQSKKDETPYDIAIVKLSKQPKSASAYKLLLNKRLSQKDLMLKIQQNISDISLTGYPGSQDNWRSKLGVMFTESVSSHQELKASEKNSFVTLFGKLIKHKLSSLGGNSGSSIVINGEVIGIHTSGIPKRNSLYGLYNLATSIYQEDNYNWLNTYFLQEARAQLQKK